MAPGNSDGNEVRSAALVECLSLGLADLMVVVIPSI